MHSGLLGQFLSNNLALGAAFFGNLLEKVGKIRDVVRYIDD